MWAIPLGHFPSRIVSSAVGRHIVQVASGKRRARIMLADPDRPVGCVAAANASTSRGQTGKPAALTENVGCPRDSRRASNRMGIGGRLRRLSGIIAGLGEAGGRVPRVSMAGKGVWHRRTCCKRVPRYLGVSRSPCLSIKEREVPGRFIIISQRGVAHCSKLKGSAFPWPLES